VDIVFCNEDEAKELASTVEDACELLAGCCKVAVVTMGSAGCWAQVGKSKVFCPTVAKTCIDATGAGDLFASGFLYMYMCGRPLLDCCKVGHILGGAVLTVVGAHLPESSWKTILEEIRFFQNEREVADILGCESNQASVQSFGVLNLVQ